MRKTKTIKIDDKEITIKELRVKDIRTIFDSKTTLSKEDLLGSLDMLTNLTPDEIDNLAPSELRIIWAAIQEVNSDFLEFLDRTGIKKSITDSMKTLLTTRSVGSSSVDIGTVSTMDSVIS